MFVEEWCHELSKYVDVETGSVLREPCPPRDVRLVRPSPSLVPVPLSSLPDGPSGCSWGGLLSFMYRPTGETRVE